MCVCAGAWQQKEKTARKTKEDGRVMPAVRSGKRFFFFFFSPPLSSSPRFLLLCVCVSLFNSPPRSGVQQVSKRKGAMGKRRIKVSYAYAFLLSAPIDWIGKKRYAAHSYVLLIGPNIWNFASE